MRASAWPHNQNLKKNLSAGDRLAEIMLFTIHQEIRCFTETSLLEAASRNSTSNKKKLLTVTDTVDCYSSNDQP